MVKQGVSVDDSLLGGGAEDLIALHERAEHHDRGGGF